MTVPIPAYAELQVTSNFSFLRGAAHPEELVGRAAEIGLSAIAITAGTTIERWLFFAQAKHVVTLYYGNDKA